ncbi:MAG: endonuclease MutS2 [Bacteroidales bacterium]|nr:endonuclease MutS2 [Bacteroidales bacterium]
MTYPQNFEQKIGFDKIRKLIGEKCLSPLGVEKCSLMSFSTNKEYISKQLNQTQEFINILSGEREFPANYFIDVRDALKRIRIEGTYLDESEVFDIRRSLQTLNDILVFFSIDEDPYPYPFLKELAGDIHSFPLVTKKIDSILDKFGRVKDNASSELASIRRELNITMSGISRTLNSILRSAQSDGIVDKDIAPTMRDGRLVIPVAPTFKRKIKGIIHDESASGKTIFIEPAEVVEANNKIRELESAERREIIKILIEFTDFIRSFIDEILSAYDFLAEIDFIRAKSTFSISVNAEKPSLNDEMISVWNNAVHPLLYLSLLKQNKKVVPLDIELDKDKRIVLISGPNAGGKSVCLKTMGLLQYMLQCGLLIPLYKSSKCAIFDNIFIDIGDEQSIENDLSTYSSHLTNMKFFLKNCSPKSLILIDEFGGGTEPQIGGAIAESILQRFNNKQAFGVITTHYQNLKHFAEATPGIVNGAMLYDRHHMQPLFRLEVGNPGSSFAIEIARKIGLPEDVIKQASEIVGSDYIDMDKYLQDIVRDKRYWENKRQNIRQQEKRLEENSEKYRLEIIELDKHRKEIIKKAKEDAAKLLSEANAKIENTIREIKNAQAEKEKTKNLRQELNLFKEETLQEKEFNDKIARKIQKIRDKEQNKNKKSALHKEKKIFNPEIFEPGDAVRIKGQTSIGELLSIDGKNAMIAFGMIKTNVKVESLEKMSKNQIKKVQPKNTYISESTSEEIRERKLNFKQDIDVRGMRAEEAIQAVTYFIDDAILVGVAKVRILHGTGTGALRQSIRQYLSTINGISSFKDEHVQFGGAGITVVELD